jgi:hypothetical protein
VLWRPSSQIAKPSKRSLGLAIWETVKEINPLATLSARVRVNAHFGNLGNVVISD